MSVDSALGWVLVWLVQHPAPVLLVTISLLVLLLVVFMSLVRLS